MWGCIDAGGVLLWDVLMQVVICCVQVVPSIGLKKCSVDTLMHMASYEDGLMQVAYCCGLH